jgi:ABC-type transport system involved in multi-copper enzyme maturation, permease component
MRVFLTLARRELGTYFVSLTGYVTLAAVALLCGWTFCVMIRGMGTASFPLPVTELFFQSPMFWFILLIANAVITMRLYAHEKYSGTYETLMTTPVSDLQVVTAKFSAAWVFYMITWLPFLGCCYLIQKYANQAGALDQAVLIGTYVGIGLFGAFFISFGAFASALTSNQMVAAMISLLMGMTLFGLSYMAGPGFAGATWQEQVLSRFGFFEQMREYAHGVIDTRSVLLLVSLTFLFLFLTLRVVESRRWK